MNLKVKKLPIILPLVVVAVILAGLAIASVTGTDTAKKHTDLGQKHLADGDYASAVTEFLQSLSLDPTSMDARLGLAQAYVATDGLEAAEDILQPLLDEDYPEAYRFLAVSSRDSDPYEALMAAQKLVQITDDPEDYALLDELLAAVMDRGHSAAAGTDQRLVILDGKVMASGSNGVGQLGISDGIGENRIFEEPVDALFPGTPVKVFCAGRTSLVLDASGDLWCAGENRWGQQGSGGVDLGTVPGWTKIADGVSEVCGTTGMMFVLKTDGSLWYGGRGGAIEPVPVTGLGTVIAVESAYNMNAVLSADGNLYVSYPNDPRSFARYAEDVKCFSLSSYGLAWVNTDNELMGDYRVSGNLPDGWERVNGVRPNFTVTGMALTREGIVLLGGDGLVRCYSNGYLTLLEDEPGVRSVYSLGEDAVIEYADGSAKTLLNGTTEPVAMDTSTKV